MAKITISLNPGSNGFNFSNITAETEPGEVDTVIQAVDKLMKHYPVLKPDPEPAPDRESGAKTIFPRR